MDERTAIDMARSALRTPTNLYRREGVVKIKITIHEGNRFVHIHEDGKPCETPKPTIACLCGEYEITWVFTATSAFTGGGRSPGEKES